MNKNIYLTGGAVALALITAALVIIIALPAHRTAAAPPTTTTATTAAAAAAAAAASITISSATPAATAAAASTPPSSTPAPAAPTKPPVRPARTRSQVPVLPASRQVDALAVAQAVVATLYSVDPAVDSDRTVAARRAVYLLTPTCAAALTAAPSTGAGAQWQQWAASGAYLTITSQKINIPWTVADNRLTVIRNIGFIQRVHTATGTTALAQQTLAVRLIRAQDGQPWRVDSLETP